MPKIKNKLSLILFFIIFFTACFIRIYNIHTTARFTRDESSDLVSMKKIIDQRRITLVGPISEGDIAIFSSLTYYLSLPFVYLLKSDPISPVIAVSFYGIITVLLIWYFLKFQKNKWLPIYLLPVFLSPFVEGSRWAWNPHFIPFWQIIGLIIYYSNIPFRLVLTGLIFGLTIHQHWYSVFFCLGLIFLIYFQDKKIKNIFFYLNGLFISIIPFIIFDLTRPPGLFITRMLYFSPVSTSSKLNLTNYLIKLIDIPLQFTKYICFYNNFFGWIILLLSIILIGLNFYYKKPKSNLFLIPILFQFIGLSLISAPIANRYLIPCLVFYIIWLSQNLKHKISKLIVILILVINIFSIPKILFNNDWTNNITALKKITNIIKTESQQNNNQFNLAVLQSPDGNTKGTRFRDLLSLQNIKPLSPDDYQSAQTLFVISYSSDWNKLKNDPAYEISNFRKDNPNNSWKIDNSDWYVYQINR